MTSLLQKINEIDLRIDSLDSSNLQTQITTNSNDISALQTGKQGLLTAGDNITIVGNTISASGGGGSTDTTALQAQVDTNTSDISGIQTNKQDTLTAGDNITITGNVISSSGGGTLPEDASFTSVNTSTLQASGNVSFLGDIFQPNRVSFLAHRLNTNETYSGGATMIYNNIISNNGNGYSSTTGIFTAPLSGTYLFGCSFYSFNENHEVQFVVGSSVKEVIRKQEKTNENNVTKDTGTCFTYLSAGTQIRLICTQGSITLLGNPQLINTFYGYFLG